LLSFASGLHAYIFVRKNEYQKPQFAPPTKQQFKTQPLENAKLVTSKKGITGIHVQKPETRKFK
jgi:hypothetical protein